MKKGSLVLLVMGLLATQAQAQTEREAYIELKEAQMIRVITPNSLPRELMDVERLEAGTILGVDVTVLDQALELQRLNPNEVNFRFKNERGESVMSRNGFVCDVRIVDVPSDEQRETELMDRKDFCISLMAVKTQSSVMEGNDVLIKAALEEVQEDNRTVLLAEVSDAAVRNTFVESTEEMLNPLIEFVSGGSGFVSPLDGRLNARSEFGMRRHPVYKKKRLHKGIDLRAAPNSNVKSALKGRVLALKSERSKRGKLKGYGHYVIVVHPEKRMQTLYAHLNSFKTKAGKSVAAGERIALSGATGVGTGPHLHFETHQGSKPVNPRNYIGKLLSSLESMIEKFFVIS